MLHLLLAMAASLPIRAPAQAGSVRFEGLVVDAERRPAPGARVVLGEIGHATVLYYGAYDTTYAATPGLQDQERARYAAEATTDAQGRFQVSGLVAGEYSAIATDPERGLAFATFKVGDEGAPALVLEFQPPGYLEVEITGLERDPSRHVIQLKPIGVGSNLSLIPRLAERGKSWSFQSGPLPAVASWQIAGTELVLEQDYPAVLFSQPVKVAPGERRRLELDLAGGKAISGTVRNATGKPLSGVSVVARPSVSIVPGSSDAYVAERGAVTDADGLYTIRGLPAGAYACDAARWILRDTPGCGVGFQDVFATKEITVPLAHEGDGDFKIAVDVPRPKVGDEAPNFEARTIDGKSIELRALRGKVVLLDFWATWCPMCRSEMPRLVEMYAERSKAGKFEIIGISVDEEVGLVPRFVASRGLPWPQTALGPEMKNPLARLYNAHSTPMTVLVDAEGRIAAINLLGKPLQDKITELLEPR